VNQIADSLLIEVALGNNDQRAFAELVQRYQPAVRYSLRQLCSWDDALADDLAQETFINAFKNLHSFNGKSKFSSWLYRIAYNQFLQHCRTGQAQKNKVEFANFEDAELETITSGSAEDSEAGDQLHQQLAIVLAEFKPERRSVLHLLLHRQCTQQEIADIMAIPLGTVKTHITRGRKILQSKLAHWQESLK